jgi:hypothetical protein
LSDGCGKRDECASLIGRGAEELASRVHAPESERCVYSAFGCEWLFDLNGASDRVVG